MISEEMILQLREFWSDKGNSQARCAVLMQKTFPDYPGSLTASALSGLIRRLREKRAYRDWFPRREYLIGRQQEGKPVIRNYNQRWRKSKSEETGPIVHLDIPIQPTPAPRHLMLDAFQPTDDDRLIHINELNSFTCRWPIDVENELRFCGCSKGSVESYCERHRVISMRGRKVLVE